MIHFIHILNYKHICLNYRRDSTGEVLLIICKHIYQLILWYIITIIYCYAVFTFKLFLGNKNSTSFVIYNIVITIKPIKVFYCHNLADSQHIFIITWHIILICIKCIISIKQPLNRNCFIVIIFFYSSIVCINTIIYSVFRLIKHIGICSIYNYILFTRISRIQLILHSSIKWYSRCNRNKNYCW